MLKMELYFNIVKLIYVLLLYNPQIILTQDYAVSDIQCAFWGDSSRSGRVALAPAAAGSSGGFKDMLSARLRKPEGFKGAPQFADERSVDPVNDAVCQIRPDITDVSKLTYNLLVTDFNRCGVLKRNGFIHVRIWFPQFPGVVMMSDQELIIMCKPPEPTIIENKAAGFAGSFPHGARVSGVVEESPGRLEYEVALYKEAPTRLSNTTNSELPVDQAVPIGTKLQLRARINAHSAWKYVKLMEVTVSPDPDDPHVIGNVPLVKDGCRNRDFASIIPHQPARYREKFNEVFLDFEAFLLSTMKERSTLWIHSQIKACMDANDCQPEYCLDILDTAGHGRRRRRREIPDTSAASKSNTTSTHSQSAKIKENIGYTVLMPADIYHQELKNENSCQAFIVTNGILGCLLLFSALILCFLALRLQTLLTGKYRQTSVETIAREKTRKLSLGQYSVSGYTGRTTLQ